MGMAYAAADSTSSRSARRVTYIIDAEGRIEYAVAVSLFGIKSHVKTSIARLQGIDP
jgi:peroxiredoxin